MKKSRIFSALLVLALLSTCVIGGTFAKYVTSGSAIDSARVAKFGVTVTATSNSMFKSEYAKTDSSYTVGDNTVVGTSSAKVIAPGTSGNLTGVTISGTPEVAVRITNEATVAFTGDWTDGTSYYCPLVVTVGTTAIEGSAYSSTTDFAAAVKTAIDNYKGDYAPGTDLSSATTSSPVVAWEWPFSISDSNDTKDTYLGNLTTAPEISVTIKTTVTQID